MKTLTHIVGLVAVAALLGTGAGLAQATLPFPMTIEVIAESYVKLALALGQHDADYVDAYYGPPGWKEDAVSEKRTLPSIITGGKELLQRVDSLDPGRPDSDQYLRTHYLKAQLRALVARAEIVNGKKFTFDEEAFQIYDVTPPSFPESHYQVLLAELDHELPGSGSVQERLEKFRSKFVIPPAKLDAVFQTAIAECRSRTLPHISLPPGESFTVEYVKNKSWSGYNWFQGNSRSLIQVNTDFPIYIDRAVDLAAHEGYPGHHVYSVLMEDRLLKGKGWIEFCVYPLFSPKSLIAEGSANYGIEVAFPGNERIEYERQVLFPLAGLDTSRVEEYYRIQRLASRLSYAGNEAARQYLNGKINREECAAWLTKYALMAPARARQRVKFIDQYRSYVINYNYGLDLVREYIEAQGGTADNPAKRWEEFERLISSPRLPSALK